LLERLDEHRLEVLAFPAELLMGNYARRWRIENGIAEAIKFFHNPP